MTTERDPSASTPATNPSLSSPDPDDGPPTAAYVPPPDDTDGLGWSPKTEGDPTLVSTEDRVGPQVRVSAPGEPNPTMIEERVAPVDDAGVDEDGKRRRIRRRRGERDREPKKGSFWRELPVLILLGVVLVILLKAFLIQAFFIPSGSMQSTLEINDRVLVNRQAYLFGDPQRGDVIVFRNWDDVGQDVPSPSVWEYITRSLREGIGLGTGGGDDLIKRIVAVPGDTIEVKDSRVFVNGEELSEPYIFVNGPDALADFDAVTVPEGKYFVMGDHRNNSQDSRQDAAGRFVDADAIVGKAFVRIWPLSRIGGLGAPEQLDQESG